MTLLGNNVVNAKEAPCWQEVGWLVFSSFSGLRPPVFLGEVQLGRTENGDTGVLSYMFWSPAGSKAFCMSMSSGPELFSCLPYFPRCMWHHIWPRHSTQVSTAAGGWSQGHQHHPLGASLPRPPEQVCTLAPSAVPAEPVPSQVLFWGGDLWGRHLCWPDLQRHRPKRRGTQ